MDIRRPKIHLAQLKMQKARLREFMEAVCATEADVASVTEDADNLDAILKHAEKAMQYVEITKKIWDITMHGLKEGEVRPENPEPPGDLILPYPPAKVGMQRRSEVRNKRFKAAPGYTKEIGAALGIE